MKNMVTEKGFTLVELAIALMIIGLLIGGVLKGQELIENTRITRLVKDINDYDAAVMIFRSSYNGLPGDIRNPKKRLSNCDQDPCQISGNGDGVISPTHEKEALNVWIHLNRAGLIMNINEDTTYYFQASPSTPFGDGHHVSLRSASTYTAPAGFPFHNSRENYYTFYGKQHENVLHLKVLDMKMDDGIANSGRMQLMKAATGDICFDGTTLDYLADTSLKCSVKITSLSAN